MSSYVTPKKNSAFIFYAGVVSQANTKIFQSSPTLASGDFKVSTDGGALTNLATLPTNTPGSQMLKFSLSAGEMNGDNITIVCSDAAGAEWSDAIFNIQTSARQIDDLAYPATTGRSIAVDAAGLVDANVVKIGPTGAGTAQTARDVGLALPAVAPNAAGGLLITAAGSLDMDELNVDIEAIQTGVTVTTNNDKTGYALTSAEHTLVSGTDLPAGLTSQGYTTARAGYLDTLNGLVVAVWAATTRTLSAFAFAVSTNPNAVENAIKAKTDNLPTSPAEVGSVMSLDLTQAIPTTNTVQTIGDALNAARAQGFGRWKLVGNVLSLYAADGLTVVKTLTFDDTNSPTERK